MLHVESIKKAEAEASFAAAKLRATKAAVLATHFLGEGAPEPKLEELASLFMRMSDSDLDLEVRRASRKG